MLVNLAHKTDTLEDLKRGLAKLSASQDTHSENVKSIKEMQSNIDDTLHAEQLMERFQKEFDLVHNDFLKTIKERYPDLNAGEVRMCAYLKMNLSTKEIATLMRISVRGVETIRYRLRRKLGLERSENLLVFLNSVFEEYKNQTR